MNRAPLGRPETVCCAGPAPTARWSYRKRPAAMNLKLLDYIEILKRPPEVPSFEPEIDDLDEKKDKQLRSYVPSLVAKYAFVVVGPIVSRELCILVRA